MTAAPAHARRAAPALQKLAEMDPAIAVLALWCRHLDAEDARSAWTQGSTIHYGAGFPDLPLHEQMGLAAHHVLHVALRHGPRSQHMQVRLGPGFNADVFNIAADALVNETLQLAGYALPRPAVLASELLARLEGRVAAPGELVASEDAEGLYHRLLSGPGDKQGDAGERTARVLDAAQDLGFSSDLVPEGEAEGTDPSENEDFDWRQHLSRAMEAGQQARRGIGALGLRIADLPEPTTPWEVVLRGLLAKAVQHAPKPTWRRPTGRWLAAEGDARTYGRPVPVFEPALQRTQPIPRIVVAIDSSGSIDAERLGVFAGQVAGIGRRTGAEVHVLVFDEEVRSQTRMRGANWANEVTAVVFSRDGGTSFVEVIACAAALDPSAIVLLTDLDGPFGDMRPSCPVIWAVAARTPRKPPFGRVLDLSG